MDFIVEENKKYYYEPAAIDNSSSVKKLVLVCTIAATIQYGWALQLSLLTPYIQLLGVPHAWASIVWLCGPISGMIVQPTIGHYSDRCTSRFGRRRPFIVSGAILLCFSVTIIGFAADLGAALGDSIKKETKIRAITLFVLGFVILDVSNNMMQGPCRALLADLARDNVAKVTIANALFAFFMAVGNIIGYGFGSYMKLSEFAPFTKTEACDIYCANLKTCFLVAIIFVVIDVIIVVTLVEEEVFDPFTHQHQVVVAKDNTHDRDHFIPESFFRQLISSLGSLEPQMWHLLLVTALNWIGWFPFMMFSTDWMGREVYGGDAHGNNIVKKALYHKGVWAGTLGLIVYVLTLGLVSLFMEPLVNLMGSVKRLWSISSLILAFGMIMTGVVTQMADDFRASGLQLLPEPPPFQVRLFAFSLFAILGIPLAVGLNSPSFLFTSINLIFNLTRYRSSTSAKIL